MSSLDATFNLTPKSPWYLDSYHKQAFVNCYGADFERFNPENLSSLYASDRFFFESVFAADPNLDYTRWDNRRKARFLEIFISLEDYGSQKQLALILGFETLGYGFDGRVLVYSDASLLQDQNLAYGDSQLLLEIESVELPLSLYFIHAGGSWFFRGISGYVV